MREESGFSSLEFAALSALAMLILAAVFNLVALQYQRGAMRVAVDEGARHGAAALRTTEDCERLATSILRDETSGLLKGRLGEKLAVDCVVEGSSMVATASGRSIWWIGGFPEDPFSLEARATLERPKEAP